MKWAHQKKLLLCFWDFFNKLTAARIHNLISLYYSRAHVSDCIRGKEPAGWESHRFWATEEDAFTSVSLGLQGEITRRSVKGSGDIEGHFLPSASFPHRKYCLETECSSVEGRKSCDSGRWRIMSQGVMRGCYSSICLHSPQLFRLHWPLHRCSANREILWGFLTTGRVTVLFSY